MKFKHQPVLVNELINHLNIQSHGIYVDCTLGGGGHSLAILRTNPDIQIIGIDQDPDALVAAKDTLAKYSSQICFVHNNFRNLDEVLTQLGMLKIDGIIMDLGVSSPQLDHKERGFSYRYDARLDMRMNPNDPRTAYDLVNSLSVHKLTEVIKKYGEERWAARIASFIVQKRKQKPITTTQELVSIIKAAIPKKARLNGPHPAKRTFQALRIAVNDELAALREALEKAIKFLRPGGRICVITFHSLEDRIVKNTFRESNRSCTCPPDFPVCVCGQKRMVKIINKKPILADKSEVNANPRARSAKLRVCERLPKEDV